MPISLLLSLLFLQGPSSPPLEEVWRNPPVQGRIRAYWWWLNGNVDKPAIARDLREMRAKGFGSALLCDAGGASQDGNDNVPHGPTFLSPGWRELFKFTLDEAAKQGMEITLNIQSGWNLGGPMVTKDDAAKKLTWAETTVNAEDPSSTQLPDPARRDNTYRDLFVLAWPIGNEKQKATITNYPEKAMLKSLNFSAPDTTPLLFDKPDVPGEEETSTDRIVDITGNVTPEGLLLWNPPKGKYRVLRVGWTIGDHASVSTSSDGWKGYALDVLDEGAFRRYWNRVVEPLLADAGPHKGKTLTALHTDSWEVEAVNWTPTLRDEFKKRRGYDLVQYLPTIAGYIVGSRSTTNRFLFDFRKTLGDLAVDHHFKPFKELAHRHGLIIHPESGGPHASPIDAQRTLGVNDMPMSEFWAESWRHRVGDKNRFFVKQPASAAHVNGHPLVAAEGFTTIGPHWQETLWDNLKPSFDRACTEGMNLLTWHAFVCSPSSMGLPGQQYFAGTHLNPNVTWWDYSAPFFGYLNRVQTMLQQGKPAADVLYYYGDQVPNFARLRAEDPAGCGPGFDYDVIDEEALLTRTKVKGGRIVMPDGVSYKLLVLPKHPSISIAVLRHVKTLIAGGGKVLLPEIPYKRANGLVKPEIDAEVQALDRGMRVNGLKPGSAADALAILAVEPDVVAPSSVRWIHRTGGDADWYFLASSSATAQDTDITVRSSGRLPEIFDPVSGEIRPVLNLGSPEKTRVRIHFEPYGSSFLVLRKEGTAPRPIPQPMSPTPIEISGPWEVEFKGLGQSFKRIFSTLSDWTVSTDPAVKFFAGEATYRTSFDLLEVPLSKTQFIHLGVPRELADVTLNGIHLGTVWAPPFRVDAKKALRVGKNLLEVKVINFWPNRLLHDAELPADQRQTKTNIRNIRKQLMPSGLLGPVKITS